MLQLQGNTCKWREIRHVHAQFNPKSGVYFSDQRSVTSRVSKRTTVSDGPASDTHNSVKVQSGFSFISLSESVVQELHISSGGGWVKTFSSAEVIERGMRRQHSTSCHVLQSCRKQSVVGRISLTHSEHVDSSHPATYWWKRRGKTNNNFTVALYSLWPFHKKVEDTISQLRVCCRLTMESQCLAVKANDKPPFAWNFSCLFFLLFVWWMISLPQGGGAARKLF